ncbi:MAG: hypothetical protein NZ602_09850, partial [Thermoguttaceae bacterium]|nr:hypothetical protein [Thermoguttaceae bacterium]
NAERIDYPRYRRMGLPVGSGQVEGACKYLVANRCKLSGMRNWRRSSVEAILALRAALQDDRFELLWRTYLPQAP